MPLGILLLSSVGVNFNQHLWTAHKVTELNSHVNKKRSTFIPDSESAVFGGFGD